MPKYVVEYEETWEVHRWFRAVVEADDEEEAKRLAELAQTDEECQVGEDDREILLRDVLKVELADLTRCVFCGSKAHSPDEQCSVTVYHVLKSGASERSCG